MGGAREETGEPSVQAGREPERLLGRGRERADPGGVWIAERVKGISCPFSIPWCSDTAALTQGQGRAFGDGLSFCILATLHRPPLWGLLQHRCDPLGVPSLSSAGWSAHHPPSASGRPFLPTDTGCGQCPTLGRAGPLSQGSHSLGQGLAFMSPWFSWQ